MFSEDMMKNSKRVSDALGIASSQLLNMDQIEFLELLGDYNNGEISHLLDDIGYFGTNNFPSNIPPVKKLFCN